MKKQGNVRQLFAPLLCMLAIAVIVLIEATGERVTTSVGADALLQNFVPAQTRQTQGAGRWLLCYNPLDPELEGAPIAARDTLDIVRVPYDECDLSVSVFPALSGYEGVLYASSSMEPLMDHIRVLVDFIDQGGRFALTVMQAGDSVFSALCHKFGVIEYMSEAVAYNGIRFTGGMYPMMDGRTWEGEGFEDYCVPLRLENDCEVYMHSLDGTPLMWSRAVGEGRVCVTNMSCATSKDCRSMVLAAMLGASDRMAYPILNSAMVFVDDFPAPQSAEFDQRILDHFGLNIQGFYRNQWWPDMRELTDRGVRLTGVLVETYNDQVEPPYLPEADRSLLRYYGVELKNSGGEMGLHGYNHMPLTLEGFTFSEYGKALHYKHWSSYENMLLALSELGRYGKELFPENTFVTYVPPSNFLTPEGIEAIKTALPGVRVLSGLYLSEAGVNAFTTEFDVRPDGLIETPRVTSGFDLDPYNEFVASGELLLQGVFSHFIHPDDVLDEERGALTGWSYMYQTFYDMIDHMQTAIPPLRYHTATMGAGAVQRREALSITREDSGDQSTFTLDGFYDEAWICLYARSVPEVVTGGELFALEGNLYWLRADTNRVVVRWGTMP